MRTFVFLIVIALHLSVWVLPLTRDAAAYAYVGKRVAQGAIPYRDVWDHKPPGIYFVDAIIHRIVGDDRYVFGLKLAALAFSLLAVYAEWRLLHAFFPEKIALLTTLVFAIATNIYTVFQGGNHAEHIMLVFLPLCYVATIRAMRTNSSHDYFVTGMIIGALTLVKQVGILPFFAIAPYLFFKKKSLLRPVTLMTVGVIVPILPVAFYFVRHHALSDAFTAIVMYNVYYATRTFSFLLLGSSLSNVIQVVRAGLFLWVLLVLGLLLGKKSRYDSLLLLFLAASLFGTAIGGGFAFSNVYFLSVFPAASYFVAKGLEAVIPLIKIRRAKQLFLVALVAFMLSPIVVQGQAVLAALAVSARIPFRESYLMYPLGLSNYFFVMDQRMVEAISVFLRERLQPGETILDWGAEPNLYLLTGASAPTRFFYNFPVNGTFIRDNPLESAYRRIFLDELGSNPPRFIVTNREETLHQSAFADLQFPEFSEMVADEYELSKEIGNYQIWERKEFRAHELVGEICSFSVTLHSKTRSGWLYDGNKFTSQICQRRSCVSSVKCRTSESKEVV